MEKMTNAKMFEELKNYVKGTEREAEFIAFLDKRIELASKKRTGLTKVQKENLETVEKIYDFIANAGKAVTINEVVENCGLASTQKASALVKKLIDTNRVVRGKDGKKAISPIAE